MWGHEYYLETQFAGNNCSGDPILYVYIRMNKCVPVYDDGTIITYFNNTFFFHDYGDDQQCAEGRPIYTARISANNCSTNYENYSNIYSKSPSLSAPPTLKVNSYTMSAYSSCNNQTREELISLYIYPPTNCQGTDPSGSFHYISCNQTHYVMRYFTQNHCVGDYKDMTYPMACNGGAQVDGCYSMLLLMKWLLTIPFTYAIF